MVGVPLRPENSLVNLGLLCWVRVSAAVTAGMLRACPGTLSSCGATLPAQALALGIEAEAEVRNGLEGLCQHRLLSIVLAGNGALRAVSASSSCRQAWVRHLLSSL